jgi:hypothetical protein
MAAWAFAGGVKRCTTPLVGAATWFSFMLAWLAALMAISPFKAFTERRGWMKATMPAEEESNGVAGTVFVGNGANAASGIAVWNCTGTTVAVGGAAGNVVEDGGAATTVESTATAPCCSTGSSTTRSSVDEGGAAGVLPLMMSSSARMRSSFASSLASKATRSNGVPDMIVDALVEVSDTKLIWNG